jgi:hypothetical protein
MKKAYISFAIAALWLIWLLFARSDFAVGIYWPKKAHINPALMMRLVIVLFYSQLSGWIVPLAFGFWSLWKKTIASNP